MIVLVWLIVCGIFITITNSCGGWRAIASVIYCICVVPIRRHQQLWRYRTFRYLASVAVAIGLPLVFLVGFA